MHQSGTHWLKHMLASAISCQLETAPPKYAYAGDMIGGHKDPVKFPGIPLFGHSHNIPSHLISNGIVRKFAGLPRYVLLVRDIRSMLVSHYVKYQHEYNCPFDEYLRGDVSNRRFDSDIWWCIRFQNAWGRAMEKNREDFLLVKYEDLADDTLQQLTGINSFLQLGLSNTSLEYGIEASTKEKMSQKPLKAKAKIKRPHNRKVVRTAYTDNSAYFTPENTEYFLKICDEYLKYDFGYVYR
ncbi:MAG TPA: sulfotransferase domain-containing protein [Gammaproteobacteria bacterium]|nr:sulfotransferase domain-containing protein [Gammaproteobacteria bacterium]